jgi:FkbM family methyltransferase
MELMSALSQAVSRYSTYLAWLLNSGYSPSYRWYINRGAVRIPLENVDDFLTTYDVYANGHYDRLYASLPHGSVLWDIGANIGVTSLIFAQSPKIAHIYAFEPMPHTFACAQRSLGANPDFSEKVTLQNLGVGDRNGNLEISYTKKAKAAIGVSEIPPRLKMLYRIKPEDMEKITIHLVDAAEVVDQIKQAHPGAAIFLKLDAEGAEYGIIDRLVETGRIADITAAAIEWHMQPGEPYLTSALQTAGFNTQAKALEPDNSIGMIDAWR